MRRLPMLLLGLSLLAATGLAALPPAAAGHEDCNHHYPDIQRACLLANWWHWCLQQVWWGQPCVVIGASAPVLP